MRQRNNRQTIQKMRAITKQFEEMKKLDLLDRIRTAIKLQRMQRSTDPTTKKNWTALEQLRSQIELCHAE